MVGSAGALELAGCQLALDVAVYAPRGDGATVDALRGDAVPATDADACAAVAPPRPISPMSTATASSRRPTFTWELPRGVTGARVEICADPECARSVVAFDADGTSGAPPNVLPAGTVFWRLAGRAGRCTGPAGPLWELWVRRAPPVATPASAVDTSWGSAPDLDRDGFAELVVAAPGARAVHVFGGTAGNSPRETVLALEGTPCEGQSVASAGDVNGDGFADLVLCTTTEIVVAYGGPGAPSLARATRVALPDGAVPHAVAGAGDVNGDGYADVVVGAPAARALYVFAGARDGVAAAPAWTLRPPGPVAMQLGVAVAGAGDVNGDGYADVLAGAPSAGLAAPGLAFLYAGSPRGPSDDAATRATIQPSIEPHFGSAVGCAGDVNADGRADLVVGEPAGSRAYVFLGSAALVLPSELRVFTLSGRAGASVDGAGDLDADGFDDVAVGAPDEATVLVILGGDRAMLEMQRIVRPEVPGFGAVVVGAGDMNGDGVRDLAVGAHAASQAYAYLGVPHGAPVQGWQLMGPTTSGFGRSVAWSPPGRFRGRRALSRDRVGYF